MPPTQERVLIIESPSLDDITTGDREGEHLDKLLRMVRIDSSYRPISRAAELEPLLRTQAPTSSCIHIAGHGSTGGFAFTDGVGIPWDQLARGVLAYAPQKIVILAACHSDGLRLPFRSLAETLQAVVPNNLPMPRCVLTMLGKVAYADSLLAWGLFYRHLFSSLRMQPTTIARCPPRLVFNALSHVKASGLNVKICAAYWYEQHRRYANISPWLNPVRPHDQQVSAIEQGEPTEPMF